MIPNNRFPITNPPKDGLTYSLPLVSASRLNPSMSLASLRLHSPWRTSHIKHQRVSAFSYFFLLTFPLARRLSREAIAHRNHLGRTGGFSPRARDRKSV